MRRRDLVLLGAAAFGYRPVALAQQLAPTVGFLSSRTLDDSRTLVAAFLAARGEAGFAVGRNLVVEYRWANGHYDRLPALAAELVARRVAAIFTAGGPPSALAAKAATTTIPIVFNVPDPVRLGLVASLAHPGGNLTGLSTLTAGLTVKRLQLLKELAPNATVFALLLDPSNPGTATVPQEAREAAQQLGVKVELLPAPAPPDLAASFARLKELNAAGIVIQADPFFDTQRDKIIGLAAQYAVPAIYGWRFYAANGGLASYGSSLEGFYRQAAGYVARILKGAKPADLPVQRPTKFELVINLKTAMALGLTIPPSLLARADEVIE
jgi:putative ABC transport system substrate-binding protein